MPSKAGTQQNAEILRSVLNGEHTPRRDVVVLNAAAGIYISGLAPTLTEAVDLAGKSIDNGQAAEKLGRLVNFSSRLT